MSDIPIGLCQCGCGLKTKVSTVNHKAMGRVKGQPYRFVHGHNNAGRKPKLPKNGLLRCSRCKLDLPTSEFAKSKGTMSGFGSSCRACERDKHCLRFYGVSQDTYDALFAYQDGVCAICRLPETVTTGGRVNPLSVDHDHSTGDVRGLLCRSCNTGLGYFKDDRERVQSALFYLNRTPKLDYCPPDVGRT